jgi:hypothetical protein
VYCRKIALAAVVVFVAITKRIKTAAYKIALIKVKPLAWKTSFLKITANTIAAKTHLKKESSIASRVISLMNKPPVLHKMAAAKTAIKPFL